MDYWRKLDDPYRQWLLGAGLVSGAGDFNELSLGRRLQLRYAYVDVFAKKRGDAAAAAISSSNNPRKRAAVATKDNEEQRKSIQCSSRNASLLYGTTKKNTTAAAAGSSSNTAESEGSHQKGQTENKRIKLKQKEGYPCIHAAIGV